MRSEVVSYFKDSFSDLLVQILNSLDLEFGGTDV